MQYAIDELEESLSKALDNYSFSMESGDIVRAARFSVMAEDFAQALELLRIAAGSPERKPEGVQA